MPRIVRRIALIGFVAAALLQPALAESPKFQVDPTWPLTLPNNWIIGTIGGITVDAQDHIWINQRPSSLDAREKRASTASNVKCCVPAPPVIEFDQAGKVVQGWGEDGPGYKWGNDGHGIHIDHNNFVWVGDNIETGGHIFKFTRDGKFVMRIGQPGAPTGSNDTAHLGRPADMVVDRETNELFVADGYGNHRVIVFDAATGAYKRMWGAFGKRPGGEDSCAIVSPKTFPDAEGPAHFNVAHAIRVANDGMVYLADRENRRVQMFTNDGKFVKQLIRTGTTFARNLALSADAGQQFLYVGADKSITVVDRKTLDVMGTIQPPGILGPGHHIATDSKGNIFLAQTTAGMQKLVFKGMSPTQ